MSAREDFYGLAVGDRICVHGKGFGVIEETHRAEWASCDSLTVRMDDRKCRCDSCGHVHTIKEVTHPHPRHVSRNAR